ncbi:hypothetical protein [Mycolicibacterium lutetiense]|uniref:Uncharacterized protein n=1 Tax=Mycolicibacterium lutetiense TaxID=1641992 RepID=A0ABS4ZSN4_9MYCO|nr:hypothetical protein [Mycolicibacterium lutetiense]MBP2452505.1 hypothetical protein [Mycolicibacterium lutetiense]
MTTMALDLPHTTTAVADARLALVHELVIAHTVTVPRTPEYATAARHLSNANFATVEGNVAKLALRFDAVDGGDPVAAANRYTAASYALRYLEANNGAAARDHLVGDLMGELGVASKPVHTALKYLQSVGLVTITDDRNGKWYVKDSTAGIDPFPATTPRPDFGLRDDTPATDRWASKDALALVDAELAQDHDAYLRLRANVNNVARSHAVYLRVAEGRATLIDGKLRAPVTNPAAPAKPAPAPAKPATAPAAVPSLSLLDIGDIDAPKAAPVAAPAPKPEPEPKPAPELATRTTEPAPVAKAAVKPEPAPVTVPEPVKPAASTPTPAPVAKAVPAARDTALLVSIDQGVRNLGQVLAMPQAAAREALAGANRLHVVLLRVMTVTQAKGPMNRRALSAGAFSKPEDRALLPAALDYGVTTGALTRTGVVHGATYTVADPTRIGVSWSELNAAAAKVSARATRAVSAGK